MAGAGQEVANDMTGLTPSQLQSLGQQLRLERTRVEERLKLHVGDAVEGGDHPADEMDVATRAEEQAYLLKLADKERKLLREIDAALERLAAGSYGVCEGTGEPIGFKRLHARPWARQSVAYKEEQERIQRGFTRT